MIVKRKKCGNPLSEQGLPHFCITPGGVEGQRADLAVLLDAVDGQIPLGGGSHGGAWDNTKGTEGQSQRRGGQYCELSLGQTLQLFPNFHK